MKKEKPFIHLLKSPRHPYIFDVNTDSIIKVSRELYDFFLDLEHGVSVEAKDGVAEEISSLKENGYLKSYKPKGIRDPRLNQLDYLLNNRVESLVLQVTQNCNMRCSYCSFTYGDNVRSRSHNKRSMDHALAIKAIDFYYNHTKDAKRVNISFYGGEPLLEFELIKQLILYSLAKFEGKDIYFNITTNAILLTPERLKFLASHNTTLMVSLDGPKEIHDKSRKLAGTGDGSFDLIIRQLRALKRECPKEYKALSFNSVIDPLNDLDSLIKFYGSDLFNDSMLALQDAVSSYSIGDFSINTPIMDTPFGTSNDGTAEFAISERDSGLLAMYSILGLAERSDLNPLAINIEASIITENSRLTPSTQLAEYSPKGGPCIPGVHSTFVRLDGTFFPCEKASDISDALSIGNVENGYDYGRLHELLNIGHLTEHACINCWAINHCSTCAIHGNMGDCLSKDLILGRCDSVKAQFKSALYEMIALDELRPILQAGGKHEK